MQEVGPIDQDIAEPIVLRARVAPEVPPGRRLVRGRTRSRLWSQVRCFVAAGRLEVSGGETRGPGRGGRQWWFGAGVVRGRGRSGRRSAMTKEDARGGQKEG